VIFGFISELIDSSVSQIIAEVLPYGFATPEMCLFFMRSAHEAFIRREKLLQIA
jgi:hypothetical protein